MFSGAKINVEERAIVYAIPSSLTRKHASHIESRERHIITLAVNKTCVP